MRCRSAWVGTICGERVIDAERAGIGMESHNCLGVEGCTCMVDVRLPQSKLSCRGVRHLNGASSSHFFSGGPGANNRASRPEQHLTPGNA